VFFFKESICSEQPCESKTQTCTGCSSKLADLNETIYACSNTGNYNYEKIETNDQTLPTSLLNIFDESAFDLGKFPGYDFKKPKFQTFNYDEFNSNFNYKVAEQTDLRIKLTNFTRFKVKNATLINAIRNSNSSSLTDLTVYLTTQVSYFIALSLSNLFIEFLLENFKVN